jgi:hypothetical protein
MHYLYGSKPGLDRKLVATFDSEQQLLAYVRWATLQESASGTFKFEQGSALSSYNGWQHSRTPLTEEDATQVLHNPTPSML